MRNQLMLLDCPAYLDEDGLARCGLPAEVLYRVIAESTDGPVEIVKISCPVGHRFNAPIEFLSPDGNTGTSMKPAGRERTHLIGPRPADGSASRP
jgi:hypothetical protein